MRQQGNAGPLRFTGINSWHTYAYLFTTAEVTYKGMLPIHYMQASLWSYVFMDLLYDTMNNRQIAYTL